ncbi:uncharacterized protein MYCGRDRAFT_97771 [Zymoseptoria tritici IPO323]|uniref:Uncharacterized protein n=1 Tax=Zymoseptoria tritici (strain CBS 115943 / IPO323) TaxID=336722 RepID=F9XRB7_ZYMTI|nr:uncharacterized protein MYCGRDRAFT_97771 [Zymoseptoria tritici IPO323]EGP82235.1 hypothetical protein MYCGRDRAFT_97771 [Zymoseptoria tritici IPO323]
MAEATVIDGVESNGWIFQARPQDTYSPYKKLSGEQEKHGVLENILCMTVEFGSGPRHASPRCTQAEPRCITHFIRAASSPVTHSGLNGSEILVRLGEPAVGMPAVWLTVELLRIIYALNPRRINILLAFDFLVSVIRLRRILHLVRALQSSHHLPTRGDTDPEEQFHPALKTYCNKSPRYANWLKCIQSIRAEA